MNFKSSRSLVVSRRNLAMRDASYCKHCNVLVPDDFQEMHLREAHGMDVSLELRPHYLIRRTGEVS